jgi:ketosteroid isomerase-like protein
MSQENVEIVRRAFAESAGPPPSPEALREFFHPDVEWVAAMDTLVAGSYHGYDGIRRFWDAIFSAWDQYIVEPLEFRQAGDNRVAVVTRMHARTRDIEVDQDWSVLVTLRKGKIARVQGFSRREGALEAAGLSE